MGGGGGAGGSGAQGHAARRRPCSMHFGVGEEGTLSGPSISFSQTQCDVIQWSAPMHDFVGHRMVLTIYCLNTVIHPA